MAVEQLKLASCNGLRDTPCMIEALKAINANDLVTPEQTARNLETLRGLEK